MNEFDNFDFDADDFDLEMDFDFDEKIETRIHKPKLFRSRKDSQVKFTEAKKLAKEINFEDTQRYDCLINGSFVFGDFIEALFIEKNIKAVKMVISTLSLNQNNIDSLRTLLELGYVDDLTLIVSDYFFSHERGNLIQYAYDVLDVDDKFQLAVARTHTKICFFETAGGKKIVTHGSANLRTSDNIEQFTIEINESLYDFYDNFHSSIIETYQTINKSVRNTEIKKIFNS